MRQYTAVIVAQENARLAKLGLNMKHVIGMDVLIQKVFWRKMEEI